jgi:hypothetical protein
MQALIFWRRRPSLIQYSERLLSQNRKKICRDPVEIQPSRKQKEERREVSIQKVLPKISEENGKA